MPRVSNTIECGGRRGGIKATRWPRGAQQRATSTPPTDFPSLRHYVAWRRQPQKLGDLWPCGFSFSAERHCAKPPLRRRARDDTATTMKTMPIETQLIFMGMASTSSIVYCLHPAVSFLPLQSYSRELGAAALVKLPRGKKEWRAAFASTFAISFIRAPGFFRSIVTIPTCFRARPSKY